MENKYYDEIMGLSGMDDLKNNIKKIKLLSDKAIMNEKIQKSMIPSMLWISEPGAGRTHILRLISDFLCSLGNIIDFSGDCKYIEFYCEYCQSNGDFTEIRRLHDCIRQAAGRRSEYRGVLCVDISKWIEHENEENFKSLLEYLANECGNMFNILSIKLLEKTDTKLTERVISDYLSVEKIHFKLPDTEELTNYVEYYLKQSDFIMGEGVREIIRQSIETLRRNDNFKGYKTLDNICSDIVYNAMASSNQDKIITKDIALQFSKDSEYIKSKVYKGNTRTIGFGDQYDR